MIRAGLPLSLALHGVVLFGAHLAFTRSTPPLDVGRMVPVELVTLAEVTDIQASIRRERERTRTPEPMQVEESVENAPDQGDRTNVAPDEVSPDRPVPLVSDTPDPDAEPVEQQADATPALDLDRLSQLIDRSRDTATTADSQIAEEADRERLVFSDRSRVGIGSGTQMTMSELDAIRTKMRECWTMPEDAVDSENLIVTVRVELLPGGFLRSVEVIDRAAARSRSPGNPFWDRAERNAENAVRCIGTFDFLSPDSYDQWQSLILNFRPNL